MTVTDVFFVDHHIKGEEQDDELLQSMIEVLGPLPQSMLQFWERRQLVVDEDGILLAERLKEPHTVPIR